MHSENFSNFMKTSQRTVRYYCKIAKEEDVLGVANTTTMAESTTVPALNLISKSGSVIETIPFFVDQEVYFQRIAIICSEIQNRFLQKKSSIPPMKKVVQALTNNKEEIADIGEGLAMLGAPFGLSGTVFGSLPASGPKGIGGYGAVGANIPVELTVPVGMPGKLTKNINYIDKNKIPGFSDFSSAVDFTTQTGPDAVTSKNLDSIFKKGLGEKDENVDNTQTNAITADEILTAQIPNFGNSDSDEMDDSDASVDEEIKKIIQRGGLNYLSTLALQEDKAIFNTPTEYSDLIQKFLEIKSSVAKEKNRKSQRVATGVGGLADYEDMDESSDGLEKGTADLAAKKDVTATKKAETPKKAFAKKTFAGKLGIKKAPPPPPVKKAGNKELVINKSKFRKIAWDPVEDPSGTIFCTDFADYLRNLNLGELEEYFGKKSMKTDLVNEKPTEVKSISLLTDRKRSQKITIILSGFNNYTFAELRDIIMNLDDDQLSLEEAEKLVNIAPTPEETTLITDYIRAGKDVTKLEKPEQFIASLSTVRKIKPRLEAFIFIKTFRQNVMDINLMLTTFSDACMAIQSSKRLKKLIAAILKIGNILNQSNALGFKINILSKLEDFKTTTKPVRTFVQYLVDIFYDRDRDTLELMGEFSSLQQLKHFEMNNVEALITQAKSEFEKYHDLLNTIIKENESQAVPDPLENILRRFYALNERAINDLEALLYNTKENYYNTVKMFGETDKTIAQIKPSVFLNEFLSFVKVIDARYREKKKNMLKAAKRAKVQPNQKIIAT